VFVEFVRDRMITLRGRQCDIIVLNVKAQEDKIDDVKNSFCEEQERVFDKFPKFHMNILLRDFSGKVGKEDITNRQLGMKVYMKLVMLMELE
jgi:hypothetical protein